MRYLSDPSAAFSSRKSNDLVAMPILEPCSTASRTVRYLFENRCSSLNDPSLLPLSSFQMAVFVSMALTSKDFPVLESATLKEKGDCWILYQPPGFNSAAETRAIKTCEKVKAANRSDEGFRRAMLVFFCVNLADCGEVKRDNG